MAAKSQSLDIAVAGCGTAGMAAALLLARQGHRVILFERFDEPRAVGSGLLLQPTGLAVLHALGLAEEAAALGARVGRIRGEADGRVVLNVDYSALGAQADCAVGIHRASLFALLHSAVQAEGIPIHTGRQVTSASDTSGGAFLCFAGGAVEGPFELIVDGLGTRSTLAPPCGRDLSYGALWTNVDWPGDPFDAAALSQRYRRASIMAGVLPIGRPPDSSRPQASLFWSLRAEDYGGWRQRGLASWTSEVRALWPETEPMLAGVASLDELTFARYAHRTLRTPVIGRIVHIGDSWHSTSPQLGQGANMALLDAYALATCLRPGADLGEGLARFSKLRSRHVRLYQLLSRVLTPVYQSDSLLIPMVRDRLVGPLSKLWPLPWLQAALVSGLVGRPLERLGIAFAPRRTAG